MNRGDLRKESADTANQVLNHHPFAKLSERELQVLAYAAAGFTDKKICQEIGIALNTLRTYWQRIRVKLGQQSRSALAVAYVESVAASRERPPSSHPFDGFEVDLRSKTFRRRMKMGVSDALAFQDLPSSLEMHELEAFHHILGRVESGTEAAYLFTQGVKHAQGLTSQNFYVEVHRDEEGRAYHLLAKRLLSEEVGSSSVVERLIIGHWKLHLDTNELVADRDFCKIYRLDTDRREQLHPDLLLEVYPGEGKRVAEAFADLKSRQKKKARITHRLKFPDGLVCWITHDIRVERDRVCGTAIALL